MTRPLYRPDMAQMTEVRRALSDAAASLSGGTAASGLPTRTLSIEVLDHDVLFHGRLEKGRIVDLVEHASASLTASTLAPAAVRVSTTSDVLLDVLAGRMTFPHAWAQGQVRVQASLTDLWTLRRLVS